MRLTQPLLIGLACAALCWQTAQAGFFDDLFGQEKTPQAELRWPPEDALQPRKSHKHNNIHHVASLARHDPGARPKDPAWEVFLDDPTLKNGDAVMTPDGLRIFTGRGGEEHNPEDFAKLPEVTGLPQDERTKLASVEEQRSETMWRPTPESDLLTGRSVARIASPAFVRGFDGRSIRYIEP